MRRNIFIIYVASIACFYEASRAGSPCIDDSACPGDLVCNADGFCLQGPGLTGIESGSSGTDNDSGETASTTDASTTDAETADAETADAETTDAETADAETTDVSTDGGATGPYGSCEVDADCMSGEICSKWEELASDDRTCRTPCLDNADCPTGPTGTFPATCLTNLPYFSPNECALQCELNSHCPVGQYCHVEAGSSWCVAPIGDGGQPETGTFSQCQFDSDCVSQLCLTVTDAGSVFIDGYCSEPCSSTTADCPSLPGGSAPMTCSAIVIASPNCALNCALGDCPAGMTCWQITGSGLWCF